MGNTRRVVVTGLGVVSCFGNDVDQFHQGLLAGKSGVKPITSFPCSDYTTRFAATVPDFDSIDYIDKKLCRRVDPYIRYAMVAGKKALEYAGFKEPGSLDSLDKTRCGVIIGSGMGGMRTIADGMQTLIEKGMVRRMSPFFIPFSITNMGGALLATDLGFMGPNYSISTACATGNHSLIAAANHIRYGEADLMVCGGVEAAISPSGLAGFCALRALSQRNDAPEKASRPWDRDRDGFVMGEGAGVLVLESLEHAQARGANILAEFRGGGCSCDAYHMTEPRPDGAGIVVAVRNALRDAGVDAKEVNYINAHATSTQVGDIPEVTALKLIFENRSQIAMNATKSLIGHLLGGAGGIEAVVCVMAIQTGKLHPTLNLENPEPSLDFFVFREAVDFQVKVAMSNSFGFGGHNASVILSAYRP